MIFGSRPNPFQVTDTEKKRISSRFLEKLLEEGTKKQEMSLRLLLIGLLNPQIGVRKAKIQRRLCSSDYFETYFNLNISDDAISEYELKKIISSVKNKDNFINAFGGIDEKKSFIEKKRFAVFLKELSLRPDLIKDQKEAEELLEILADLIDKGHDAESLVRSDDLTDVYQLYVQVWEAVRGEFFIEDDCERVIRKLITKSSVNLLAQLFAYFKEIYESPNFKQEQMINMIGKALQQKIHAMLINRSLLSLGNRLRFCLFVYSVCVRNNSVLIESLNWMLNHSSSVDKLARCFTSISISADGSEKFYAHDDEIEQYFDVEKFYYAINFAASEPGHDNAKRFKDVSKYKGKN